MMVRVVVLMVLLVCKPVFAMETLRVLAWPGYVSPAAVRSFEVAHNVTVDVTVVSTDDELWNKGRRNDGGDFDVIALNSVELRRFIDKGLVALLQLRNIPNTRRQLPRFRKLASIPGLSRDGHVYGIPYAYSAIGLIYNRKLVTEPPTSMNAMWDPRYRGKVLAYNSSSHSFSFTALAMGLQDPFNLNPEQFRQVLDKLVALRSNVLKFYSQPEEVVDIFHDNEVALIYGNYGEQQLKLLRAAGADVGYAMPSEGALAWLDCWAVMSQANNRSLAEAWINHMLTPSVAAQFTEEQGFANTLRDTPSKSTTRDSDKLFWLAPVEDIQKRTTYWERIMSGAAPRPRY
jgi:putative spermidine/putrescine transport system substrate-binding protein